MVEGNKSYYLLKDIDFKIHQYATICAIINTVSPVLKRNKLVEVILELMDESISKPGFVVKLIVDSEVLSEFLNFVKRGYLVNLNEIKIVKNDGEVYGEVWDEEDIQIFDDKGLQVKWRPQEANAVISSKLKSTIKNLLKWKCSNLTEYEDACSSPSFDQPGKNTNKPVDAVLIDETADNGTAIKNSSKKKINTQKELLRTSRTSSQSHKNQKGMLRACSTTSLNHENQKTLSKTRSTTSLNNLSSSLKRYKSCADLSSSRGSSKYLNKSGLASENSKLSSAVEASSDKKRKSCPTTLPNQSCIVNHSKASDFHQGKKPIQNVSGPENIISSKTTRGKMQLIIAESCRKTRQSSHDQTIVDNIPTVTKSRNSPMKLEGSKQTHLDTHTVKSNKMINHNNTEKLSYGFRNASTMPQKGQKTSYLNSSDSSLSSSPKSQDSSSVNTVFSPKNKRRKVSGSSSCLRESEDSENDSKKRSDDMVFAKQEKSKSKDRKTLSSPNVSEGSSNIIKSTKTARLQQNKFSNVGTPLNISVSHFSDSSENGLQEMSSSPIAKLLPNINCKTVTSSINKANTNSSRDNEEEFSKSSNQPVKTRSCQKEDYKELKLDTEGAPNDQLHKKSDIKENKSKTAKESTNQPGTSTDSKSVTPKNKCNEQTKPALKKSIEICTPCPTNLTNNEIESDEKKKPRRSTANKTNDVDKKDLNRLHEEKNILFGHLQSLTKKNCLKEVENIGDVSFYNIEEVSVPDKFDLSCKVVSCFFLFEDDIQIVRVQDGTIQKENTLVIPEKITWKAVTEDIIKNPVVQKDLPFLDIIIFNYSRMDLQVVVNNFYMFRNLMAVTFQLKKDPRKGKNKNELFICGEGQNMYVKKVNQATRLEIEKKLEEATYKICWNKAFENELVGFKGNKTINSEPNRNTSKNGSPAKESSEISTSGKRKATSVKSVPIRMRKKAKVVSNSQSKYSLSSSSDETMLGETPPLLREIKDIMCEEQDLGLLGTEVEDIHLKNSGTEVGYSQFCKVVDEKSTNFRTSTQDQNLSDCGTTLDKSQLNKVKESDKMDPLVYCTSESSKSSTNGESTLKVETLNKGLESEQMSESLLKLSNQVPPTTKSIIPPIKSTELKSCNMDNKSDISSSSSSIKLLSSNSSDTEVKIHAKLKDPIHKFHLSKDKRLADDKKVHGAKSSIRLIRTKSVDQAVVDNGKKAANKNAIDEKRVCEQIDVNSDSSSQVSFFSVENFQKTFDPLKASSEEEKQEDLKCALAIKNKNQTQVYVQKADIDKIPEKYFFKSSLPENEFRPDENSMNFCTYSFSRHLPFLTFGAFKKMKDNNYITASVTLVSTTPAITDSWPEEVFKSRCSKCEKLYSVYSALNNKQSANTTSDIALLVGSHIVCPDSQCSNQVLEDPKCKLSFVLKLKDGKCVTALIEDQQAQAFFGYPTEQLIRDGKCFNQAQKVLYKVRQKISDASAVKVEITRENICDPSSGPLFLRKVYL